MADYHSENIVRDSQISPSPRGNLVSSQEKICPAPSLEPTTQKDFEVSGKSLKYGPNIDEQDRGLEAPQPSAEGGSEGLPSRGRLLFTKYRIFFHLFVWLVMTGSVPF
jgi:hypothetical protein